MRSWGAFRHVHLLAELGRPHVQRHRRQAVVVAEILQVLQREEGLPAPRRPERVAEAVVPRGRSLDVVVQGRSRRDPAGDAEAPELPDLVGPVEREDLPLVEQPFERDGGGGAVVQRHSGRKRPNVLREPLEG
jgi:hypothetical protein